MTNNKIHHLIIYVPGLSAKKEDWEPIVQKLKQEAEAINTEIIGWDHNCTALGRKSIITASKDFGIFINQQVNTRTNIKNITLIGHSIGGLIVRQAFYSAKKEDPIYEWANLVSRIVLLASLNRGVSESASFRLNIASKISKIFMLFRYKTFIYEILRGSNFIVNQSLGWIKLFAELESKNNAPEIVKVLGTEDTEVTESDCNDVLQFKNAYSIFIEDGNHIKLHDLKSTNNPDGHYENLFKAVFGKLKESDKKNNVIKSSSAQKVLLIVHGIRDNSYTWATTLKQEVKQLYPDIAVRLVYYGFFSAFDFAFSFLNLSALRKFKDEYQQAVSNNPMSQIYFLGHSNATFLLGKSLNDLSLMNFDRIYVAGSVLSQDYDWQKKFDLGQVKFLRNDQSRFDWPVAYLCNALKGLGKKSLGISGYAGFKTADPRIKQYAWLPGGHSCAFEKPSHRKSILNFLFNDPETASNLANQLHSPNYFFDLGSRASRFSLAFVLLIIYGLTKYIGIIKTLPILLVIVFLALII